MKQTISIITMVLLFLLNIYLFSELRKTKAILDTADLFGDLTQVEEKPESELLAELKRAQAELDKIYLLTATVHILDSASKKPIANASISSSPVFLSSDLETISKQHKFLYQGDEMNILSPVASNPYHAVVKAPGYKQTEIDLGSSRSSTNPVIILMEKIPNQNLQPTVKTPVESGNEQGTAAEL